MLFELAKFDTLPSNNPNIYVTTKISRVLIVLIHFPISAGISFKE